MSAPILNLVVVRSTDIERASHFYATLGLSMHRESHGSGPSHYVSTLPGLVFEIYPLAADQPPTTGTRLGFRVDSVDRLVPLLLQAGGSVVSSPGDVEGGRQAVVSDVDGHRVELFAPTDRPHHGNT